ncbi:unnamed protein product, partial [Polarella glacialis]
ELLFRGFLLTALLGKTSRGGDCWQQLRAVVLSSAAFGAFHCSPWQSHGLRPFLPTASLGVVFGLVFLKSGDLLAVVLVHQAWNGFHMLLLALLAGWGASPKALELAASCYA